MSHVDSLDGISVVVPAAGLGARMEVVSPKQYIDVAGKSILEHTLARILGLHPDKLVLVVSPDDNLFKSIPGVDQCEIAIGGVTRIDSVLSGLGKLHIDADDWVMVHDAVHPCVRTADILLLCNEVRDHEIGGLLGIPVTDTVKRADGNLVAGTIDRSQLWFAQTPQIFRYGILLQALRAAPTSATDESSAVEALGHQPMMVQGHSDNIKVTTQNDLSMATFYLQRDQRQ